MSALRYTQVFDGDWIQPRPQQRHYFRCCDCGASHRIDFRVRRGKAEFRAFGLRRRAKAKRIVAMRRLIKSLDKPATREGR